MGKVENSHGEADVALVSEATAVDNEMFAVLADEHRRFALYTLLQFRQLTLEELADVVAGWTNADGWRAVTREQRDAVLLALHHNHVPMLEAAGYVEYDDETDELSLAALPTSLYDLVTYARKHERVSAGELERRDSTANDSDDAENGSDTADGGSGET
ncbi:DUF7344 domain-containing protein [Haloprofundus salilacus]|uniref:DUF7344 domain-containing protein n=1 Tax=Haloprofundus salilacus TaxID=2876190 RepID=UPI001CCCB383|nr:hypothetical protein [Haloprofundus salilacus]